MDRGHELALKTLDQEQELSSRQMDMFYDRATMSAEQEHEAEQAAEERRLRQLEFQQAQDQHKDQKE
jgi:hypothetical protein